MPRRLAAALLAPPVWTPPGVAPEHWRLALAEDTLDVLAQLAEVEAAVVVPVGEGGLRSAVGWPGLLWYEARTLAVTDVLAAIAAGGPAWDQVALIAADVPDLPGMTIAKLLRPLTTRPLAVAPATDRPGLLGLASRLPAPDWLPGGTLDELSLDGLRRAAPQPSDVAMGSGWHRQRGPDTLAFLDPRLEGWDATRALLA